MIARPPNALYTERLRTPWWWYLGAVAVAVVLGAEFAFAVSGWITWIPLLVLLPACLLVVWRLSSASIAVSQRQLIVPGAGLELADVDRAIGLSSAELRRLVGRHSDPVAFVFIRSWVGPGVQLVLRPQHPFNGLTESESPDVEPELALSGGPAVPYWVVSTRHPDRLLAALNASSVPIS